VSVQDVEVIEVIEMLVATVLMVVFDPIVSSSTELEYVTNKATVVVREAQSLRAVPSARLSLLLLLVVFSASFIFELTFVSLSFDWYRATNTFFKELELVLQVAM
jgi:hypothetical protein